MNEAKMNELTQAEDIAYFRVDLCCYSPESYSLEEKKEICNDMMSTSKAVLDAMREDFEQLPRTPVPSFWTCFVSPASNRPSGGGMLRALSERALWHVRSEKARALSPRSPKTSSNSWATETRSTASSSP